MNKNKYLVGIIGLAIGFIISFFWTQHYNKANAPVSASGPQASGGAGGQQAMMAKIQQTIEKAKSNPGDFNAQVEAAGVYDQIGRTAEAVEYLQKANAIDPKKFNEMGAHVYVGRHYLDEKNYREAETWFRRGIEGESDPSVLSQIYVLIAETLTQREPAEPDHAIQELQLALKANPKNSHALGHLVDAYALKRDARGADEALAKLKATDPANDRLSKLEKLVEDLKAGKPVTLPKE